MKKIILTFTVLCLAALAQAQKYEGLALTPPMGWNSWNTFEVEVNEKLIKETVDILVSSGMREAGYTYVVVDDGWEALERDDGGNLVPDPKKFPSGMKALGDYIHANGLKFGIHNDAGTRTCNGFPGGRGHEYQDARLYASWGVDYLKYDWCATGTANAPETYKTMRDALYAAKRPVVFSLCEWGNNKPWEWAQDIGHLWRTTGDITDCYNCQGEYDMGLRFILQLQEGLEKYAGPGHWNDPDMLEVGNPGLSLAESRSHFTLWSMLAAPLMAGNDLRKMTPETLAILTNKDAIAINQDKLGKQAYRYMKHLDKVIYVKELSNDEWAIAWHNTGDKAFTLRINWKHFDFLNGTYNIKDVWKNKAVGTTHKNMEINIDSHDVVFLKLRKS
ncbi:glycoside hydrolase family 27 protein [Teredinibacter haidensis]|uniref:glycoside hydrolase family 27 protein n=1 Tax=Teredinibacter haidensis TaxID=2731755 RepID=UPI0009490123|nr:glycoside hydrolase family 27 protein [Teredinibacter haidensis]